MFVRDSSFCSFLRFLDLKKNSAGWRKKIFYLNVRFLFLKKNSRVERARELVCFVILGIFLEKYGLLESAGGIVNILYEYNIFTIFSFFICT